MKRVKESASFDKFLKSSEKENENKFFKVIRAIKANLENNQNCANNFKLNKF